MFSTLYSDPVLVANLPASPLFGMRAYVTDATSKQIGSTVVGGGANSVAVYWSGANWLIGDLALAAVASSTQLGVAQVDGTTITASIGGVISGKTTGALNPSATAGPVAVNGTATTYMTSDSAPAVRLATNGTAGLVKPDGTTILVNASGVISGAATVVGANPTATAGQNAVNGTATTFLRSDGAPAVQVALSGTLGIVRPDGTTITLSGTGVLSTPGGANPTATAGSGAVNGTATTFMRSDGAPALPVGGTGALGIVKADGTTITVSGTGVLSTPGGHNPTATAGSGAVNGTATTFMRSDAAPALPVGGTGALGIVQADGTTITVSGTGVISAVQPVGANPTATAGSGAINGTATTFMRSDAAPVVRVASSGTVGLVAPDNVGITVNASGVISTNVSGSPAGNPTATAGRNAINGTAGSYMRSDGAPAIQVALSGTLGIVQPDNVSIVLTGTGVIKTGTPFASQTIVVAPAAPNGTGAFTMQGLNGTLTPAIGTQALVIINAYCTGTATLANDGIAIQVSFGTGAHPTTNAALSGSQAGSVIQFRVGTTLTAAADLNAPISVAAVLTGLTVGTTYWVDLAAKALLNASSIALNNVCICITEL